MSNNIWGYQGLQTPLENLTKGDYNVADYTNMRKEFNARLTALENAGGFVPTNVSIQGFCNIVPGTSGFGNFSVSGNSILTGTLSVGQDTTLSSNLSVQGNITSVSGQFTGNGAGLTGLNLSSRLPSACVGNTVFNNNTGGATYFVNQSSFKFYNVILTGNSTCTLSLLNVNAGNTANFPDTKRYVTIIKNRMADGGDYNVTVPAPSGYVVNSAAGYQVAGYNIPLGVFSVTFLISGSASSGIVYVV